MVFNATFNNISVISWRSVFVGGGNRSTRNPNNPVVILRFAILTPERLSR